MMIYYNIQVRPADDVACEAWWKGPKVPNMPS